MRSRFGEGAASHIRSDERQKYCSFAWGGMLIVQKGWDRSRYRHDGSLGEGVLRRNASRALRWVYEPPSTEAPPETAEVPSIQEDTPERESSPVAPWRLTKEEVDCLDKIGVDLENYNTNLERLAEVLFSQRFVLLRAFGPIKVRGLLIAIPQEFEHPLGPSPLLAPAPVFRSVEEFNSITSGGYAQQYSVRRELPIGGLSVVCSLFWMVLHLGILMLGVVMLVRVYPAEGSRPWPTSSACGGR
jgi:hypothetical protein